MNSRIVPGWRWVRLDLVGTATFCLFIVFGVPLADHRPMQIAVGVVSMTLFAIGAAGGLWAYIAALERSRVDEIGVANLFLLTGRTAPASVKHLMSVLLTLQVVVAFAGAIIGATGLGKNEVNALAFGILVPMFGIGVNGIWAVRHGTFAPRLDRTVQPSNRSID
jgi:hypothetical protein